MILYSILILLLFQVPINPYGKAKKMSEDIILDLAKQNTDMAVMILRLASICESAEIT